MLIVFLVASTEFMRFWAIGYGGFTGHDTSWFGWFFFALSWVLDNSLANAGQIFGRNITDLHAVSSGAQWVTFAFNVLLEVFFFSAIVRTFGDYVWGNPVDAHGNPID
jgi:hypothetical protein